MKKLDMIAYIKKSLATRGKTLDLPFEDLPFDDIQAAYSWVTHIFEPIGVEYDKVYALVPPENWVAYETHNMMGETDLHEIREMAAVQKKLKKVFNKRPEQLRKTYVTKRIKCLKKLKR